MSQTEAGLRWLGILPEFRRQGYAKELIAYMVQRLPPEVSSLYEVTRNPISKDFFLQCGFSVVTDLESIKRIVEHAEYDITNGGWVLQRLIS